MSSPLVSFSSGQHRPCFSDAPVNVCKLIASFVGITSGDMNQYLIGFFCRNLTAFTFKLMFLKPSAAMGAKASQTFDTPIICTVACGQHEWNHKSPASLAICDGNPPVTGGFPSQRASDAESFSYVMTSSWRRPYLALGVMVQGMPLTVALGILAKLIFIQISRNLFCQIFILTLKFVIEQDREEVGGCCNIGYPSKISNSISRNRESKLINVNNYVIAWFQKENPLTVFPIISQLPQWWGLGDFPRWWPPSTMWVDALIYLWPPPGMSE